MNGKEVSLCSGCPCYLCHEDEVAQRGKRNEEAVLIRNTGDEEVPLPAGASPHLERLLQLGHQVVVEGPHARPDHAILERRQEDELVGLEFAWLQESADRDGPCRAKPWSAMTAAPFQPSCFKHL